MYELRQGWCYAVTVEWSEDVSKKIEPEESHRETFPNTWTSRTFASNSAKNTALNWFSCSCDEGFL